MPCCFGEGTELFKAVLCLGQGIGGNAETLWGWLLWGDACFTKHHIVKEMQLHILCRRTGANTIIIIAWSLELSESNNTYEWFAAHCEQTRFDDLSSVTAGPLKKPGLFLWWLQRHGPLPVAFPRLHHALCGLHLSKVIRNDLTLRNAGHRLELGFTDAQVIAVCSSKTDQDYRYALSKLTQASQSASGGLVNYNPEKWCCNDMAKKGIPTFGHCTSNVVEGTNGVLEPARHKHPYY